MAPALLCAAQRAEPPAHATRLPEILNRSGKDSIDWTTTTPAAWLPLSQTASTTSAAITLTSADAPDQSVEIDVVGSVQQPHEIYLPNVLDISSGPRVSAEGSESAPPRPGIHERCLAAVHAVHRHQRELAPVKKPQWANA